jgi:hypothetical protein
LDGDHPCGRLRPGLASGFAASCQYGHEDHEMKTTFVCRAFPLTCIGALLAMLVGSGCADSSGGDLFKGKEFVECRVSLMVGSHKQWVEWRITDPERIKNLVQEPLSKATKDPDPAKYVVKGRITLKTKDGTEEVVGLFSPWGRIKAGGQYLIADTSKLQKAFKKAIDQVKLGVE